MENRTCSNCEYWEDTEDGLGTCGCLVTDGKDLMRMSDLYSSYWKHVVTHDDFLACGYWKEKPKGPFFWSPTATGGLIFVRSQASSLAVSDKTEGEAITNWLNNIWEKLKGKE